MILLITKEEELNLYESTILFVIISIILIEKKKSKKKILGNIRVLLTLEKYLKKRALEVIARIIIRIEI